MKRVGKSLLFLAAASLLLLVAGFCYSCSARSALKKEDLRADRDPVTGIVRGTEPFFFEGPGDRAVLLVHGWIGSPVDFHDLGERLHEKGVAVRAMLLPGHGTTPLDLAELSADDQIDAVRREFLDLKEKYPRVAVAGFSMGGALAVLLASEEPVDRLVLAAPYFSVTYKWYYVLSPKTWNDLLSPIFPYVMKPGSFKRVNKEGVEDKIFCYRVFPTRSVSELIELGRRAGDPRVLGRIECPVLVLQSHGDMASSSIAVEECYALIASDQKEIAWFDLSNHHLFWDHEDREVIERVVEFVAGD